MGSSGKEIDPHFIIPEEAYDAQTSYTRRVIVTATFVDGEMGTPRAPARKRRLPNLQCVISADKP
jgi:hypothetical protein